MRHVAWRTAEAMCLPVRLRQLRPAPLVHHLPRRGAGPEGCGAPILLTLSALVVPVRVNVVVVPVVRLTRLRPLRRRRPRVSARPRLVGRVLWLIRSGRRTFVRVRQVARRAANHVRLPIRLRQLRPVALIHHFPLLAAAFERCRQPVPLLLSELAVPVRVNVVVVPIVIA
eukprot:TRINITY_DN1273_c0_g1_i16.p2 TRINITY_DN1273_c0_g1~~TRINITY_DN1273_c0_g1_i16.p2  ORF type:complete len:171 (-),score=20.78 TRINITY_DN1273_c0_g1_i16:419-931(-)